MPEKILSRTLEALRVIYRLPGQRTAPLNIELDTPLQIVHDVSREAERQRTLTILNAIQYDTVAGSATTFATRDVAAFMAGTVAPLLLVDQGLEVSDVDLWLLRTSLEIDDTNLATAAVGLLSPDDTGSSDVHLLRAYLPDGSQELEPSPARTFARPWSQFPQQMLSGIPVRIPRLSTILLGTTSGAGGQATGQLTMRFAVCPVGVVPPAGLM